MKNTKRFIVFDFDGVLVDSFEHCFLANRISMAKIGKRLHRSDYRDWFTGETYKKKKSFAGSEKRFLEFERFFRDDLLKYYHPELFTFARRLLSVARRKGGVGLISFLKSGVLMQFLKKQKLTTLFDFVLGDSADKSRDLAKLMKRARVQRQETLFLSDTAGDIKAGNKAGVVTVAVTWGFHSTHTLRRAHPIFIFKNPKLLIQYLKSFEDSN